MGAIYATQKTSLLYGKEAREVLDHVRQSVADEWFLRRAELIRGSAPIEPSVRADSWLGTRAFRTFPFRATASAPPRPFHVETVNEHAFVRGSRE
jgi:hypothetical protein